jgi:phosphohistidine phosphatase
MKLYVMRHGPAEDHAESGVDADRPLSASGRQRVCAVGKLLVQEQEDPLAIVTSPLVRAVQTAEIVALVTALGEKGGTVDVRRDIAPGGDGARLVHHLLAAGSKRVMLVGHEPDLSGLVSGLLGSFGRAFEKAMVVGIHMPANGTAWARPRLRFILDPKALRLDAEPGR